MAPRDKGPLPLFRVRCCHRRSLPLSSCQPDVQFSLLSEGRSFSGTDVPLFPSNCFPSALSLTFTAVESLYKKESRVRGPPPSFLVALYISAPVLVKRFSVLRVVSG